MRIKKTTIIMFSIIFCGLLILTGCNKEASSLSTDTSEELVSILLNQNISNADKSDMIVNLASAELTRANTYKEKIKSIYKETVEDFSVGYKDIGFSLDSAYQSVDDYCGYLENEFSANIEFYKYLTTIKYHTGSEGAIFLAQKKYECAKSYADKLETLYEDLIS